MTSTTVPDDRASMAEANARFLNALSRTTRSDYLAFVRCRAATGYVCYPERTVKLDDPKAVALYLESPNLGKWSDLLFNRGRRDSGRKTYSPIRYSVPEEDLTTMARNVALEVRRYATDNNARVRFAEATRSSAFSLSLGVREIKLIESRPWDNDGMRWLSSNDVAALQRLVDKGLLVHERGHDPRLSEAGELLRKMLVLSNHVVEPETSDTE